MSTTTENSLHPLKPSGTVDPTTNSPVPTTLCTKPAKIDSEVEDTPKISTASEPSTSTAEESPLKEFTLFPRLPVELRHQIWDHSMSETRVIEVLYDPARGLFTDSQLPSILHTCQESRLRGLSKYTTIFVDNDTPHLRSISRLGSSNTTTEDQPRPNPEKRSVPFRAYINYDHDILYLSFGVYFNVARTFLDQFSQDPSARLQSIACDIDELRLNILGSNLNKHPFIRRIFAVLSNEEISFTRRYSKQNLNKCPHRRVFDMRKYDSKKRITWSSWSWCYSTHEIFRLLSSRPQAESTTGRDEMVKWNSQFSDAIGGEKCVTKNFVADLEFILVEAIRAEASE